MDSLTQFVLGSAIQGVGMGKYQGRKSLVYGGLLGTLPDLDVFIRYADPISSMTYHRGFSHSIFLLTALAFLITWITFKRKSHLPFTFRRLFLTLTLALVTHPIIDAMTVYGTQLFWPLPFEPITFSTVFVIDPIYTLPLVFTCIWAYCKKLDSRSVTAMSIALLFGCIYFTIGFLGRSYHEQRVENMLTQQGIEVDKVLATPTPFNTVLWRVLAIDKQGNLYDAISGWLDNGSPEFIKIPLNLELKANIIADSPQLQRLEWFSGHWIHYEQIENQLIASDTRMGLAGQFNFRFVVAEKQNQGWKAILPIQYPTATYHINKTILAKFWQRIWSDDEPLPLEDWARL
ncbi:metal-dependent hydrolase [Pasteurella canis]|uniref:metal-dependent hydrolase n=1 Tax=Pasteurella canis TaxID=753 RepID=UPI00132AF9EC|nr:metal-dependent hydrolase [Pasteurella canis]MXN88720.1 metal-dependent hydrolase [Pasteurella canis]